MVSEYAVSNAFAIQSGVLFTTNGALSGSSEWQSKTNINNLKFPIKALYKLDLGGTKLFLQAGPYLNYALSGEIKWNREHQYLPMHECKRKITFGYPY